MKNHLLLIPAVLASNLFVTDSILAMPYDQAQKNPENISAENYSQLLSSSEKEGLLLMREEEKLARDVYLYLYDKWGVKSFNNISQSEQQHMNSVKSLLDRYDIADPIIQDEKGVFQNEEMQSLYNDLIQKGSNSLVAALNVGATIEDLDIYDLQRLSKASNNQALINVYENLERASENHLRAFNRQLIKNGEESYQAQYISQNAIDEILDNTQISNQKGSGRGMGNGRNRGQNQGRSFGKNYVDNEKTEESQNNNRGFYQFFTQFFR